MKISRVGHLNEAVRVRFGVGSSFMLMFSSQTRATWDAVRLILRLDHEQ